MDNIFTALVRRRTTGVVMEFVLWCIVCFAALLSLIALAMGAGNFVWILLLLTAAGLGVIMAFRLKEVALLYSVCVFNAILFLIHYLVFSVSYGGGPQTAFSIVLFILTFLLSLAVVACAFVQFFSRVNMGTVLTILEICNVALIMIMQILMYAAQYVGEDEYYNINTYHRSWMNAKGYWIGTTAFWLILVLIAVFYAYCFWGPVSDRADKLYVSNGGNRGGGGTYAGFRPGMRGVTGAYARRTIYLDGRTLTIGSSETVNVYIPDPQVSRTHCAIRFNSQTGYYEILDQSTNGVYLGNGARLYQGRYTAVQSGTTVFIASHQFMLL